MPCRKPPACPREGGKGTQLGRSSFLRGKNQAALFWTTDVANAQAHGRMVCKSCAGSSCRSARPPSLNRSIGSIAAAVSIPSWRPVGRQLVFVAISPYSPRRKLTANCRARGRQLFGRGRQLFVSQRGERFETNVETETQLFSIAASRNNPTSYTFNADNYEASTKDASPMGKTDTATLLDKNGNGLAERNPPQLITNIKLPFPVWAWLGCPSGCSLPAATLTYFTTNDG